MRTPHGWPPYARIALTCGLLTLLVLGLIVLLTACGGTGGRDLPVTNAQALELEDVRAAIVTGYYVTRFTDPETGLTCYTRGDGGIWCDDPEEP